MVVKLDHLVLSINPACHILCGFLSMGGYNMTVQLLKTTNSLCMPKNKWLSISMQ